MGAMIVATKSNAPFFFVANLSSVFKELLSPVQHDELICPGIRLSMTKNKLVF